MDDSAEPPLSFRGPALAGKAKAGRAHSVKLHAALTMLPYLSASAARPPHKETLYQVFVTFTHLHLRKLTIKMFSLMASLSGRLG